MVRRDLIVDETKWRNWDDGDSKTSVVIKMNDDQSCEPELVGVDQPQRPQRCRQFTQRLNDYEISTDTSVTT